MNSSEFIIPQDQIKNNIVTSGFSVNPETGAMFSVNLEQTAVPATPGRHNLFFFLGSSAAFSFSQTRLRLIFRRYVNFFLSRKGLARENQSLGPGLSFFTGLARHFLSPRPDHDLFLALCKLLFLMLGSSARKWALGPGFSSFPVQRMENRFSDPAFFLPKSSARKSGSQPQLFFLPKSSARKSVTQPVQSSFSVIM